MRSLLLTLFICLLFCCNSMGQSIDRATADSLTKAINIPDSTMTKEQLHTTLNVLEVLSKAVRYEDDKIKVILPKQAFTERGLDPLYYELVVMGVREMNDKWLTQGPMFKILFDMGMQNLDTQIERLRKLCQQ